MLLGLLVGLFVCLFVCLFVGLFVFSIVHYFVVLTTYLIRLFGMLLLVEEILHKLVRSLSHYTLIPLLRSFLHSPGSARFPPLTVLYGMACRDAQVQRTMSLCCCTVRISI